MQLQQLLRTQLPNRLSGVIVDTAQLIDLANPTGTVTFDLYGPDDVDCSAPSIFTSVVPVAGNGTYQSASFPPTLPGAYRWIASYSGDPNNPPIDHSCGEPNEKSLMKAGALPFGVNSKSFRPDGEVNLPSWFNDVANLGVGRVRLDVRYLGDGQNPGAQCDADDAAIDAAIDPIRTAAQEYLGPRQVRPLAVLDGGILRITLDPLDPSNPAKGFRPGGPDICEANGQTYLQLFPARAAIVAEKLAAVGVTDFQIWNEPNVDVAPGKTNPVTDPNPQYIQNPAVFAQLVFDAATAIWSVVPGATIVTGGVFISDDNPAAKKLYLRQAMTQLNTLDPVTPHWSEIGVHPYWGDPADAGAGLDDLATSLIADGISPRTMWVTEFGAKRLCATPDCLDFPSNVAQKVELVEWYEMIEPRMGSGGINPVVTSAFWYTHQSDFHANGTFPAQLRYGLTNWIESLGFIAPSQDWLSWPELRDRITKSPLP